ncbi:MAG: DEAD/DEAH box helicase [Parvularculaceae bacterium]
MTSFSDFGLLRPITTALEAERHTSPTPIQAGAIPPLLAGRDLLGIAQTGTGKTAAFALPILHRLGKNTKRREARSCRALVLTPTRELALQIVERFKAYGNGLALTTGLVIGGTSYGKQRAMLQRGVDILVATPGRLIDIVDSGAVKLSGVETFVLDEVDQMLDLGFINAIRSIAAKLPEDRQNVFFSATMPPTIAKLANGLLKDPARVEIAAAKPLRIDQSVMFIEKGAKPSALIDIVKKPDFARGLVFTRTKHGADKLVRTLNDAGAPAHAIHGNRSQSQREKALEAFRGGRARILVATDIAARGIDVRDVTHVVNYDLPNIPETYTHRIGRTGRAGAAGVAISFCSGEERPFLRAIEKLTRQPLAVIGGAPQAHTNENRQHAAGGPQRAEKNAHSAGRPKRTGKKPTDRRAHDGAGEKGQNHGERGTDRVRRRRHRGAPGRELSRQAG